MNNIEAPSLLAKKAKKATRKKENASQKELNPFANLNKFKSIKIPEKFEEKEKLLASLKSGVGEIDLKMKTLKSQREYYNELIEIIEKEIIERREKLIKTNRQNSGIANIQDELYSKYYLNFYSFTWVITPLILNGILLLILQVSH
jgi:hypothetical protein